MDGRHPVTENSEDGAGLGVMKDLDPEPSCGLGNLSHTASFTTAKLWKQLKCLQMDGWVDG